jgi:hypothetical protein
MMRGWSAPLFGPGNRWLSRYAQLEGLVPEPPLFDDKEKTRIASLLHSLLLSAMLAAVLLAMLAIVVYQSLLPLGLPC